MGIPPPLFSPQRVNRVTMYTIWRAGRRTLVAVPVELFLWLHTTHITFGTL